MAMILFLVLVANGLILGASDTFFFETLPILYKFSRMLDTRGQYWLYWSFDNDTISFAVNVETTGWVGFGLSPNGQMSQSDVVIGWVDNDKIAHFHVSQYCVLYFVQTPRMVGIEYSSS